MDERAARDQPVPVSVVIPAFNAARTITQQLDALDRQRDAPPFEVIVADNASTDDTARVVREHLAERYLLRLVDASAHRGPAAARNVAVEESNADLLIFCDADDIVSETYVGAMTRTLQHADLASGTLSTIAFARTEHPSLADLRRVENEAAARDTVLMTATGFYHQVMTGLLAVRREVHKRVGGFREDLLGGGEDLHFGAQAQILGFRLAPAPGGLVHVRPARGFWANYRQQKSWSYRGLQVLWELREHGNRQFSIASSARGVLAGVVALPGAIRTDPETQIEIARNLGNHMGELTAHLHFRRSAILEGLVRRLHFGGPTR